MKYGLIRAGLLPLIMLSGLLQGCAVNVTTDNFIYQDEQQVLLDMQTIKDAVAVSHPDVGLEAISVTAEDGATLSGIALRVPQAMANVVLYGGNGMTIAEAYKVLPRFARIPVNVVWFDYRGTGSSDGRGSLSIDRLKKDALLVFQKAKDVRPEDDLPTVIHGLSMGSLLGAYVANNSEVSGLVLDGAIANVPDLVQRLSPALVEVNLDPELASIDNREQLKQYQGPLMLMVGDEDTTTPPEFTQSLYQQSASQQKFLEVIEGASHGVTMKHPQALKAYRQFLPTL